MLMIIYMIMLVMKYFALFLTLLNSNEKIHEQMLTGVVRCPGTYFDVTPSGSLINNFSNDLGILDNSLGFAIMDMLEGLIYTIIAMINICQFYINFIPVVAVILIIACLFYLYARSAVVQCKHIDLSNKNPIFQAFNETIGGLVQVKTYNRRRSLIQQFS